MYPAFAFRRSVPEHIEQHDLRVFSEVTGWRVVTQHFLSHGVANQILQGRVEVFGNFWGAG